MNHPLASLIYSGGALVQNSDAPAAPLVQLTNDYYKEGVGRSQKTIIQQLCKRQVFIANQWAT